YKTQRRGGRGIVALTTREEDFVEDLYITSTHDTILFFTNMGKVYSLRAYEIPEASRQARGTAIINLLNLTGNEKITATVPIEKDATASSLALITKQGTIKRTELESFDNIRKNGIIAISLKEDDELIDVRKTDGNRDIIVVTKKGMSIRFNEK